MGKPQTREKSKSKNFSSSSKSATFEFCKVCKLNNNQGRKHKYFPTHAKKVASLLSRFLQKLSDVKFFLTNPSFLLPNLAERGRLWCVFCELDLSDVGSTFVCGNVIYHLASVEHLKSVKSFLSKNGGGTDRTDSFRLIEFDVLKWEKKCKELSNFEQSSSGRFAASMHASSKGMRDVFRLVWELQGLEMLNQNLMLVVLPLQVEAFMGV
ncbi:hypothetical protein ZOSMA_78G00400 [Zostera marina]|uniref:TITAN-like protein n=1 Tax=Zostera marina TaxID=29655 RepID=A0A0K9NQB6_ZOSMR|nr:hypothetical protein ZOSMA_78G00400 [Zostera marina]